MQRRCRSALLAIVMAVVAPAASAQPARELLQSLEAAIRRGDIAEIERHARTLLADPDFMELPWTAQFAVHGAVGYSLAQSNQCNEAIQLAQRVVETHQAEVPSPSRLLFAIQLTCDDRRAAADTLEHLVDRDPGALSRFQDQAILSTADYSTSTRLLAHLANGSWRPRDPTTDISMVRLSLVRAYLSQGHQDLAAEAAQALITTATSDLGSVVMLLSDKSFDPITAADPEAFNLNAILEWQLSGLRAAAEAEPRRLAPIVALADGLYARDRLDEAMALVDQTMARISADQASPPFVDMADQLNWLHQTRASIVQAQGDTEAALENMRRGAEAGEHGQDNVSQVLNRAALLVELGRGEEALAAIAGFDASNASPYGRGVERWVRACANAQLDRQAQVRAALSEAITRAEDSYNSLFMVALCANDSDTAASAYIRHFDDPMMRRIIILSSQQFLRDIPVTDHQRMMRERQRLISERPDVRAAREANMHERSYSIRRVH